LILGRIQLWSDIRVKDQLITILIVHHALHKLLQRLQFLICLEHPFLLVNCLIHGGYLHLVGLAGWRLHLESLFLFIPAWRWRLTIFILHPLNFHLDIPILLNYSGRAVVVLSESQIVFLCVSRGTEWDLDV
jgi:hypothetical protein